MSARQNIFQIIKYTFMLNMAVGLVFLLFPDVQTIGTGLSYNESYTTPFTDSMKTDINPDSILQDKTHQTARIFDLINIGFISQIASALHHFLYGIIDLFGVLFAGFMDQTVFNYLFNKVYGIFYVMMNIGYIFAIWSLWTGQDE